MVAPPRSSVNVGEIKLEDIDFERVKECSDQRVLKRYIKLLEDDGGHFIELLNATKDKLREVNPKEYYLLYPRVASFEEVDAANRDILDWEAAVKETDAALRNSKKDKIWDDEPSQRVAAPIRGQEPTVARPNVTAANSGRADHRRPENREPEDAYARDKANMKDYYRAWDNIDVDAMEEQMEQEEREQEAAKRKHFEEMREDQERFHATTPIAVDLHSGSVPKAHRKHMADSEKEKGNEAFYAKDYEEAEAYYSRSLHYLADDPSTWANRALVRLKLQQAAGALEDCEHALALNPKYMKALHRKGKALHDLNRYEEAVQCFQLALAESPGNTQINGDLMVARRKLRTEGSNPPPPRQAAPPRERERMVSRPVDAPPTCIVEEVEDDDDDGDADEGVAASVDTGRHTAAAMPPLAAGYTRVQIEEDSDSESGEDETAKASAPQHRGFTKVVIEEEDSEEEAAADSGGGEGGSRASTPLTGAALDGCTRVAVEEDDDSQEEPVAAAADSAVQDRGFTKVLIEEDSEEEALADSRGGGGGEQTDTPPRGAGLDGFTRVAVEEDDDSGGEVSVPAAASTPAAALRAEGSPPATRPDGLGPAADSALQVGFDDMD